MHLVKQGANLQEQFHFRLFEVNDPSNTEYEYSNELMREHFFEKEKSDYKCPLTFYYILKKDLPVATRKNNLKYLLENGLSFDADKGAVDSEKRDIYMHVALKNDRELLDLVLELKDEEAGASLEYKDKMGKSVAHYIVKPLIEGSY